MSVGLPQKIATVGPGEIATNVRQNAEKCLKLNEEINAE